jgi:hypothetical protein
VIQTLTDPVDNCPRCGTAAPPYWVERDGDDGLLALYCCCEGPCDHREWNRLYRLAALDVVPMAAMRDPRAQIQAMADRIAAMRELSRPVATAARHGKPRLRLAMSPEGVA